MSSGTKVAIIGTGTMGQALGRGLLEAGVVEPGEVQCTVRHARRVEELRGNLPFAVGTDNAAAARGAEVILLCTKPKTAAGVLSELADAGALDHSPLVISIAAGVSTRTLGEAARASGAPDLRIVRAMPNTPCLVQEGMTVLSPGEQANPKDLDRAETLFRPLGRVRRLDEEHMDAVTGLSGSGPAFVYVIIEALADGGVMTGLSRKAAVELAAQTVHGAAKMVLETGRHPAALKDEVTTPAGCTVSALLSMEDGRLRSVLARGVQEAARTAAQLGKPKGG